MRTENESFVGGSNMDINREEQSKKSSYNHMR